MAGKRDQPERKTRISLVLGSGGARGYAHIGVIKELEAQGYEIGSIAGSSMGALIGGVYAAGKLDAYRDWVSPLERMDVFRLLDWTLSGGGFIKGNRIIDALRDLVGATDIEDLPIPYTAVAVDIDAQREVWFSSGPLFDAIRASIAIPTLFRPHHYQGRTLVDGGLLNPLPVAPTLRDDTDYTLAVDVNAQPEPGLDGNSDENESPSDEPDKPSLIDRMLPSRERSKGPLPDNADYTQKLTHFIANLQSKTDKVAEAVPEPGIFDLFARSLDTIQGTITHLKLAAQPPDLLIGIPRNASAFYEFHRAEYLIELGRQRTREALDRWQPRPRRHPQG
ncbi:MAG: patatin-like phospholipase family protein [Rhodanobacteraceae bacterium]